MSVDMTLDMPLLEARGLVKYYGDRAVVNGVDLECRAGSVLGLLGPNGAGKTTTLRMLYGFLDPDGGTICVEGRDFARERTAIKRNIGVCTQEDTLDYDFSVRQNLLVYASYFRPRVAGLAERVEELLEHFGLKDYQGTSPHALSGGYKRRLMIARSIIHRPKLLFLDEPTTGLDPAARLEVWEMVKRLRAEGLGVILTTHYMDEAERLSDELLVIERGKSVARGTTRSVLGKLLGDHVLVVTCGSPTETKLLAALAERKIDTRRVLDEWHAALSSEGLAELMSACPEIRMELRPPTLDDLFLSLERRRATSTSPTR